MGSDSYKAFDVQAGVRGEHTHQVLRSSIEGSDRTVNRFEVFPSVHLGYTLPHEQKLTFAYSYRTNRPELFLWSLTLLIAIITQLKLAIRISGPNTYILSS